jgi:hypothetical protein
VLLVVSLTLVEVAHLHRSQGASSTPCQICQAAHTTVVVIGMVVLPLMLALTTIVIPCLAPSPIVFAGFELFIRPPPCA